MKFINLISTLSIFFGLTVGGGADAFAKTKAKSKPKSTQQVKKDKSPAITKKSGRFEKGLQAFRAKDFERAAVIFHSIAYKKTVDQERIKARYYLGASLFKLDLKQIAAFPLMTVAIDGNRDQQRKSLDLLVAISNSLSDQELLNYALDKVKVDDISEISKEAFYLLLGDKLLEEGKLTEAAAAFEKSIEQKGDNNAALYRLGVTYLKLKKPEVALNYFNRIWDKVQTLPVTDQKHGMALISRARALYQAKKYNEAAQLYSVIPKDHPFYRESQLELAWSYFRNSKLRSSLSTLQTLHTPYYENFWDPESLVLRSLILLFVCQHDEMEKSLGTFDKHYNASFQSLKEFIERETDLNFIFKEIQKSQRHLAKIKAWQDVPYDGELPFFAVRTLLEDAAVKSRLNYLTKLDQEKILLEQMKTKLGKVYRFGSEIIESRKKNTRGQVARIMKTRMAAKVKELTDLSTQMDFIRYEMLNGQRLSLKKKMSANYVEPETEQIKREVLVENGYRYWPFQGEYWRDEIGNYQYFGRNRCD